MDTTLPNKSIRMNLSQKYAIKYPKWKPSSALTIPCSSGGAFDIGDFDPRGILPGMNMDRDN